MNKFFEKYATAIWMLIVVIWALVGFFFENNYRQYLMVEAIFWSIFAMAEFVKIKNKKDK